MYSIHRTIIHMQKKNLSHNSLGLWSNAAFGTKGDGQRSLYKDGPIKKGWGTFVPYCDILLMGPHSALTGRPDPSRRVQRSLFIVNLLLF